VTGGAGFIGASLVRSLASRGDEVVVLDTGEAAGFHYLAGTAARIVRGDVRDVATVTGALRGVDSVVHLAAQTSVPGSVERPFDDLDRNALATLTLLEASRAAGVRRFLLASSTAVLGAIEGLASEDVVPRPVSPYAASKLSAEAYLHVYHATHGLVTTAIRIANAYGPFGLHKSSVVAAFVRAYLEGEELTIFGSGDQTRDLIHVDDVVSLMLTILDAPEGLVSGEVFQAGSGTETSVSELAAMLGRVTGEPPRIRRAGARPGDLQRSTSDISKAMRVLGHVPRVSLEDGVASTLEWSREALRNPQHAALRPTGAE
jgi:UDP-glucose 4-epimerase